MAEDPGVTVSCGGCGCIIPIILGILVLWAVVFGLPVNGKTLDIDLLPPAVNYK